MNSYGNKEKLYIIIIMVIVFLFNISYVNKKACYYVDEGMTLFLANGHYNGAVTSKSEYNISDFIRKYVFKPGENIADGIRNIKDMLFSLTGAGNYSVQGTVKWYDDARNMLQGKPGWISGEALYDEITVAHGEQFNYIQMYINQAVDVHPCIYYFLVHTVFSVFAGKYSDFYLWGINIVFLLMTCVLIYKIAVYYSKRISDGCMAMAVYGFSQGFTTCAVYFRMYAVLTFWVVLTYWILIRMYDEPQKWLMSRKRRILIAAVFWGGFNTHYYYILYFVPAFIMTMFVLKKNKAALWAYTKTIIEAAIVSLLLWPFSVYHIFFGYRGTQAMDSMLKSGLLDKIVDFAGIIKNEIFYGNAVFMAAVILLGFFFAIMKKYKENGNLIFWIYMLLPCAFYIVIVTKVAPVVSDRYYMCIYPFITIAVSSIYAKILHAISENKKYFNIAVTAALVIIIAMGYSFNKPNYLDDGIADASASGENYNGNNYNCMMIGLSHGQGFSEFKKLIEYDNVLVVGIDEIDINTFELLKTANKGNVIYIYKGLDAENILKRFPEYNESGSDIVDFRRFIVENRDFSG